ncbi:hypothetical protein ACHWQZ_G002912 [Mnemiopsis leidyi]
MGCGNSKNATLPIVSESNLGSEGSSQGSDEKGSDEEIFIQRRTWGSPAPPLPDIPGSRTKHVPPLADVPSGTLPADILPHLAHQTQPEGIRRPSSKMEMIKKHRGGAAFLIQDENSPARINPPPRRLQALKGAKPMTLEDLTRKQREHERKREQRLREKTANLARQNSRQISKASRDFEAAQRVFVESESRLNKVSKNREGFVKERVMKVREHNKKVIERKRSLSVRDEDLSLSGKMEHDMEYNKSESESWADNDSIKNIYDQMEFITPASGLASAVTRNKNNINTASDDEFFS